MRLWFSHRRLQNTLRRAGWTMDPVQKDALKAQLLKAARNELGETERSVLAFNWNRMKRYSFAYLSFLLGLGVLTMSFFPKGTLSAQEVLSSATAHYENSSDTIFYEKREVTDYQSLPMQVTLEEVWSNAQGDVLQLLTPSDGHTEGSMIKLNEAGVPIDYESENNAAPLSDEELNIAEAMKSGAYYCAVIQENRNNREETLLQVSKADPSIWFISSGKGDAESMKNGYGFIETAGSVNVKSLLDALLLQVNQNNDLSESNDYHIEERTEEGAKKYVLSQSTLDELGRTQTHNYVFNAQSFELQRQEYYVDENLYSKTTYLEHRSFDADQREVIFDAESHGLIESAQFTTLIPSYIQTSGCYDGSQALNESETNALLQSIPEEARIQYEETLESLNDPKTMEGEDAVFLWPSSSHVITQGFKMGHAGLDIAREQGDTTSHPDIYAIEDGVVISTETGWNGGYGNAVMIDHGNGYVSHYTHLYEFYVEVGDTVTRGQVIGLMGNTGRVYGNDGTHMHFELKFEGVNVNPIDYLEL